MESQLGACSHAKAVSKSPRSRIQPPGRVAPSAVPDGRRCARPRLSLCLRCATRAPEPQLPTTCTALEPPIPLLGTGCEWVGSGGPCGPALGSVTRPPLAPLIRGDCSLSSGGTRVPGGLTPSAAPPPRELCSVHGARPEPEITDHSGPEKSHCYSGTMVGRVPRRARSTAAAGASEGGMEGGAESQAPLERDGSAKPLSGRLPSCCDEEAGETWAENLRESLLHCLKSTSLFN